MDIPLDEEDSSDEEYHPDEEEEDETAEDVRPLNGFSCFVPLLINNHSLIVVIMQTFQESDMESTASSPRGTRLNRVEEDSCSPWQVTTDDDRIDWMTFPSHCLYP